MKKLLFLLIVSQSYAIVPTTDVGPSGIKASKDMAEDTGTMTKYIAQATTFAGKLKDATTVTEQMKNLKGLSKLSGASELCRLCAMSDRQQLYGYVNSVNDDLCSQFSMAYNNLTGMADAATKITDIMNLLTTNPKEAMMSLQQASIATQQATNNTLSQIRLIQTQAIQKELAKEKAQQQVATDSADSLKDLGL